MHTNKLQILASSLILSLAASLQAAVITFDTAADFNNNFVETVNGANTVWNSNGYLVKTTDNAATGLVFNLNDNDPAGTNRASGTYDNPRNLTGGTDAMTFKADFQFSGANNGNSLGFYLKMPDATGQTTPSGGYAILFRTNTGGGEVRFWDYSTNNNIGTAAVNGATPTNTQSFDGGTLVSGTWYTAQVEMQDVGGQVVFSASLFETGVGQIGATKQWIDTTSPVLGAGQWGMRLSTAGGHTMLVDNVSVIPEPGTLVLLGVALGAVLLFRRRHWGSEGTSGGGSDPGASTNG
jgi:hypothetical protein